MIDWLDDPSPWVLLMLQEQRAKSWPDMWVELVHDYVHEEQE